MRTILVVDDEPAIRALLRAALEGTDCRLLEAADGVDALRTARSERPDLILLDIALPGLSGFEVCRRLRDDPATVRTPVLVLTGMLPQTEWPAAEEAGAQGFVTKPFSPAALVAQIDDALRRGAPLASPS